MDCVSFIMSSSFAQVFYQPRVLGVCCRNVNGAPVPPPVLDPPPRRNPPPKHPFLIQPRVPPPPSNPRGPPATDSCQRS